MFVERYKMKYTTKADKKLKDIINHLNNEIYKEIKSDNIRILGQYFVKNNENKAKLIK